MEHTGLQQLAAPAPPAQPEYAPASTPQQQQQQLELPPHLSSPPAAAQQQQQQEAATPPTLVKPEGAHHREDSSTPDQPAWPQPQPAAWQRPAGAPGWPQPPAAAAAAGWPVPAAGQGQVAPLPAGLAEPEEEQETVHLEGEQGWSVCARPPAACLRSWRGRCACESPPAAARAAGITCITSPRRLLPTASQARSSACRCRCSTCPPSAASSTWPPGRRCWARRSGRS
jgi:hypothetical protein